MKMFVLFAAFAASATACLAANDINTPSPCSINITGSGTATDSRIKCSPQGHAKDVSSPSVPKEDSAGGSNINSPGQGSINVTGNGKASGNMIFNDDTGDAKK
jgi:hypothetical protein